MFKEKSRGYLLNMYFRTCYRLLTVIYNSLQLHGRSPHAHAGQWENMGLHRENLTGNEDFTRILASTRGLPGTTRR